MNLLRRACLVAGAVTLALGGLADGARAAGSAVESQRLLVGFAPGGAVDVLARALAEAWYGVTRTPVIVENRAGAGGRLAIEVLLREPADGRTAILMPGGNVTLYPHVYRNLSFDPMRDLQVVAPIADFVFALAAGPAVPVSTLEEYVAWARAQGVETPYATPGAGTAMHFAGGVLGRAAGFKTVQAAYRGGAPALNDVLGGHVPVLWATLPQVVGPHRDGRLKVLAHTGAERLPNLPDVPTFREAGYPDLTLAESFALFVRDDTPPEVVEELRRTVTAAMASPSVMRLIREQEMVVAPPAGVAFEQRLREEFEQWRGVVEASGYSVQD